jgi:hypothetical protein
MMRVISGLVTLAEGKLEMKGLTLSVNEPLLSRIYSHVVLLDSRCLLESTENLVKETESTLSPDDKTADVTTRSKLKEVKSPHVDKLNTGQVAECLNDTLVLIVHDERTTALAMSAVSHFTLTRTNLARVGHLENIPVCMERFKEGNSLFCFRERFGGIGDNEGNFVNLLNTVAASKDERGKGGGGKGRDDSETALVLVHLDVPFTPGLGRSEHTTSTAHVTESTLGQD